MAQVLCDVAPFYIELMGHLTAHDVHAGIVEQGCEANVQGRKLLEYIPEVSEADLERGPQKLVFVSPVEWGFRPDFYLRREDIYDIARAMGFWPCHPLAAVILRANYLDQPKATQIFVGMTPIGPASCPQIFELLGPQEVFPTSQAKVEDWREAKIIKQPPLLGAYAGGRSVQFKCSSTWVFQRQR